MELNSGTILLRGKYKIERLLGQGGFGITYLASMKLPVQGPLGMIDSEVRVAIKEFFMKDLCNRDSDTLHVSVPSVGSKELVEKFRKKFIKEANNIALLQHPNIIKVIEVFEENGTAYYVMEHVDGVSLHELVGMRGALPQTEALRYIRQVAAALDYIHQKKMNHFDVKPANILLRNSGGVVLIDFGLSKQYDTEGEQTSSTPVGRSVGYAPIEQSMTGGISQFSAPTDIYSLGATLYKLVTGKIPPAAYDIMNNGFPQFPEDIDISVVRAIQKAMEPGKQNRPQSIPEFLHLFGEYSDTEETKVRIGDFYKAAPKSRIVPNRSRYGKIVIGSIFAGICVLFLLFWKFWPQKIDQHTDNERDVVSEITEVQDNAAFNEYDAVYQNACSLLYQGKYARAQKEFETAKKHPGCPPQNDIDVKINECKQKLAEEQRRADEQRVRQEEEAKLKTTEVANLLEQANETFNNSALGLARYEQSFQLYKKAKDLGGDVLEGYVRFISMAELLIENDSGFDANVKMMLQYAQQLNDTQKVRDLLEKCN